MIKHRNFILSCLLASVLAAGAANAGEPKEDGIFGIRLGFEPDVVENIARASYPECSIKHAVYPQYNAEAPADAVWLTSVGDTAENLCRNQDNLGVSESIKVEYLHKSINGNGGAYSIKAYRLFDSPDVDYAQPTAKEVLSGLSERYGKPTKTSVIKAKFMDRAPDDSHYEYLYLWSESNKPDVICNKPSCGKVVLKASILINKAGMKKGTANESAKAKALTLELTDNVAKESQDAWVGVISKDIKKTIVAM